MDMFLKAIAIFIGKALIYLSKLLGNQGTDFPGRIARLIYPNILIELSENITDDIIVITGTNGKTTTSNLIASIVKYKEFSYVHNKAGANLVTGITTAFLKFTDLSGETKFNYAILETDEANIPLLLEEISPSIILITNFFRDQLDRFGELDYTINLIKQSIKGRPIDLLLNADDPLVTHFHNDDIEGSIWYYGFDKTIYDSFEGVDSREGRHCVNCGQELSYERYHYEQLGKYECNHCENTNPKHSYTGYDLKMTPFIEISVNDTFIKSQFQGFYNAYNILAAVSLAKLLEIDDESIKKAIIQYKPQAGRMETFLINDKKVVLILVKNPAGLNQALSAIIQDEQQKTMFFALNDNAADGRDVSWIWDADVERIMENQNTIPRKIICSGIRSGDIALRFKYTGYDINSIKIEPSYKEAINEVLKIESECVYVLCTYTALFEVRNILVKMQQNSKIKLKEMKQEEA